MEDARHAALTWLQAQRGPEGAWPYTPQGQPRLEPTLWALAAGLQGELSWLESTPWGWEALLVPAALSRHPDAEALRSRGLREILARRSETYAREEHESLGVLDPELPGWSWYPGTFGWIEPTAMGLLSLRCMGLGDHERATQAQALLLDRQHHDGGWNYGNNEVLGARLESFVPTTAWAILALPAGPHLEPALAVLRQSEQRPSTLSLSLAILALGLHQRPTEELAGRLLLRQEAQGSFGRRCDWTALAATALHLASGGSHVFHLPS